MPATTIPTKTTITLRIIRPKLISDNSRMAAISLQRNRIIPTRMHRSNLHSPSKDSRRTDRRITHNRRSPPIISSRRSPDTSSPHTISRQSTRSRPTIRRPNSSPATVTRRSRRSSPACSACSSVASACITSIWDTPARPWLSCC